MTKLDSVSDDFGFAMQEQVGYWSARKNFLYYKALFQFVSIIGYDAKSIIDVGSAGTEYLKWMSWIPRRTLLDYEIPNKITGIEAIEIDFFDFITDEKYDVALCCQVLEHVEHPELFCQKLKSVCRRLLITVPFKWAPGTPGHIHDPVDMEKLHSWMGIYPTESQVIYEPFLEGRLIAYYDLENPKHIFKKDYIFRAIAEKANFIRDFGRTD